MGYTFLLHIQLYELYPVLVIIPSLLMVAVVHFVIQSGRAGARIRLQRMFGTDKSEKVDPLDKSAALGGATAAVEVTDDIEAHSADSLQDDRVEDEFAVDPLTAESEPIGELHLPRPSAVKRPTGHMTRKESTRFGMKVLGTLKRVAKPTDGDESDEGKENLSDAESDDGVSLPISPRATSLHPSGSRTLLPTQDGGSGQNSKTSLTPSEEVAFVQAFSAKTPMAQNDPENSSEDSEGSDAEEAEAAGHVHTAHHAAHHSGQHTAALDFLDGEGTRSDEEQSDHDDADLEVPEADDRGVPDEDPEDDQELSEEELAEDGGSWEDDEDQGYDDSDEESYEWEQAYEYTGDRAEHVQNSAQPRTYGAHAPTAAAAAAAGADGDSIFGSHTHSSDEEENTPGVAADSETGSDLDFAQYTAKATAWAGGVREHTLAVAMYDLALNDHKSDTSDDRT
jgi:hypothetical protein